MQDNDKKDKKIILSPAVSVTCVPFLNCGTEGCRAFYLRAEDVVPEESIRYAQDIGWIFRDNKSFCPECTVEERAKKPKFPRLY